MTGAMMLKASTTMLGLGLMAACTYLNPNERGTTVPKLHLHISQKDGKTQTGFGIDRKSGEVVFYNKDEKETLKVSIESEPGKEKEIALCQKDQKFERFTVTAEEKQKSFTICSDYSGMSFKYTAVIGHSISEDPIIIIE